MVETAFRPDATLRRLLGRDAIVIGGISHGRDQTEEHQLRQRPLPERSMYGFSGVGERGADELGASQEELYRTLVVSNLVAIHLKSGVGPLPAYRGATSAGCGLVRG